MASVRAFAELTLQSRDREALERFYTGLLGLEVLDREDDRTWLAVGPSARLGLWTPGEKEFGDEGGAHVHFAFSVDDEMLDAIAGHAQREDHDVQGPIEHDGGDRSLYVTDPEGNVIEMWSFFAEGNRVADLR